MRQDFCGRAPPKTWTFFSPASRLFAPGQGIQAPSGFAALGLLRRLLARCLNNCALAYGEAARSMRKSAAEMQGQAIFRQISSRPLDVFCWTVQVSCLRLSQPTQDLPKGKGTDGDLPPWALEAGEEGVH